MDNKHGTLANARGEGMIEVHGGQIRLRAIKIGKIIITTEKELANLHIENSTILIHEGDES